MAIDNTRQATRNSALFDFSLVPEHPSDVWLFQAVPDRYDLQEALASMAKDDWLVNQFKNDIESEHVVVLWQAGENGGIYGIGMTEGDKFPSSFEDEDGKLRIDVRHLYVLPKPILRRELKSHPVLAPIIKSIHQGTNFKVSKLQWQAIYELMYENEAGQAWWWVNQGNTSETEMEGGYVFSIPLEHGEIKHHTNVKLLKKGDRIVHYAQGQIYATSVVTKEFSETNHQGEDGWLARVKYSVLAEPIPLEKIPEAFRKLEKDTTSGSVFDKNGGVRQGYLFPLSDKFILGVPELAKLELVGGMRAPSSASRAHRSYTAWSVLVKVAERKETITYGKLAKEMGIHPRIIRFYLSDVQDYCLEERLPPLSIVALSSASDRPGEGFVAWDIEDLANGLAKVHNFNWTQVENPFAYASDGTTEEELLDELIASPANAADIYRKVKVRGTAQEIFKKLMRRVYNCQCAFCGLSFLPALEAAHIVPWNSATQAQRLAASNGILLCSTHHKLFDAKLMTLDESYNIVFCDSENRLGDMDVRVGSALHGSTAYIPQALMHQPDKQFLAERNRSIELSEKVLAT